MTTTADSPPVRRKLRNFLLDARFQLKFTLYAIALSLFVAILLGSFLYRSTQALVRETELAVEARSKAAESSRGLSTALLNNELLSNMDDPSFAEQLKKKSRDIDAGFEAERAAIVGQRAELQHQQRMAWLMLAGCLLGFILLSTVATIIATHKVAGPLLRIRRLVQSVAEGRLELPPYNLRDGDEVQDVFEATVHMIQALRDQQAKDLSQVRAAIAATESSGGSPDALSALRALEARVETRVAAFKV